MRNCFDPDLVDLLDLTERQPGVLVCGGTVGHVDQRVVGALKGYAETTPKRRARILFHRDETEMLHEMLISAPRHSLWPPHINDNGAKSWLALDGEIAYVQFEPPGEIVSVRSISAGSDGSPSFLRLSVRRWHTIVPISDMPVYLETSCGPHVETRYADWGPQDENGAEAENLYSTIKAARQADGRPDDA